MATLRSDPLTPTERSEAMLRVMCWSLVLFVAAIVFVSLFATGGRAREPANRIKCSSNLRQLGLAMKVYANQNGGVYPPSLGAIMATQQVTPYVFCCPSDQDIEAAGIAETGRPTTQSVEQTNAELGRQIDDLKGNHCSYLYAGLGLTESTVHEDDVLAFEMPSDHEEAGMNVLYGDGHVDWIDVGIDGPGRTMFDQLLAEFKTDKRPLRWSKSRT